MDEEENVTNILILVNLLFIWNIKFEHLINDIIFLYNKYNTLCCLLV